MTTGTSKIDFLFSDSVKRQFDRKMVMHNPFLPLNDKTTDSL